MQALNERDKPQADHEALTTAHWNADAQFTPCCSSQTCIADPCRHSAYQPKLILTPFDPWPFELRPKRTTGGRAKINQPEGIVHGLEMQIGADSLTMTPTLTLKLILNPNTNPNRKPCPFEPIISRYGDGGRW